MNERRDQNGGLIPPGDDDHDCSWKAYGLAAQRLLRVVIVERQPPVIEEPMRSFCWILCARLWTRAAHRSHSGTPNEAQYLLTRFVARCAFRAGFAAILSAGARTTYLNLQFLDSARLT